MSTLLDTNVLSELLRLRPDPKVLAWFALQANESLYVSAITQAEMTLGARLLPAGRRRKQLETALDAMFQEDFADRVLAFDARCAHCYAEVVTRRRAAGLPISQFDAQIAAVSLAYRLELATRNVADFQSCGVKVVNPWDSR